MVVLALAEVGLNDENAGTIIVRLGPVTSLSAFVTKVTTPSTASSGTVTRICVAVPPALIVPCLFPPKMTWSIRSRLVPVTVMSAPFLSVTGVTERVGTTITRSVSVLTSTPDAGTSITLPSFVSAGTARTICVALCETKSPASITFPPPSLTESTRSRLVPAIVRLVPALTGFGVTVVNAGRVTVRVDAE